MDELAFERIYMAHAAAVRAYVVRRVAPADVDDALAEIWLVAWRRRADLPAAALPWLFGAARRVLANHRRGRTRFDALIARIGSFQRPVSLPAVHDRALGDALARLGPADREALLLVAWEGLTADEAAEAMACSTAAFNSRLHRARVRLARELDSLERGMPRALEPKQKVGR